MTQMKTSNAYLLLAVVALSLSTESAWKRSSAQGMEVQACTPISQRTGESGCWVLVDEPMGPLTKAQVFWHLDVYPTRAAAEANKGPRGSVVESLGKFWLMTIDEEAWRPAKGQRIAKIGPLPINAGEKYSAQYMEAIFTPGMTSSVHNHPGPEAWYTMDGETCLETPDGTQVGRADGPPVIVRGDLPMHLTATGTEKRRALVLVLHESAKPPGAMVHDWAPKGLCKN